MRDPSPLLRPTDRELKVLSLVADGLSNDAIARLLNVSIKTLEATCTSMFRKLVALELTTRFVVEMDDIALLSNEWHFASDDLKMSGITAEVARRQPDGRWLYIIDNPYAVAVPDA